MHISGTASRVPSLGAELMATVQMVQSAIINGGWKNQFRKFQPGSENLGNLTRSPQDPNKLWFAENNDQMEQFIREQFFPPVLVVDVLEGAYRIPARALFAPNKPEQLGQIVMEAARFFGGTPRPMMTPVATQMAEEFTGVFGDSVKTDSREITYLSQVRKGALDPNKTAVLLGFMNDPTVRARVVQDLTNSFTSLYRMRLSVLSSEFLVYLSQLVANSGLRIFDPTTQSGYVPLAGFIPNATNFAGFQNFAYQRTTGPANSFGGYSL